VEHLKELFSFAEIQPTVNQIEFSPFLNQMEDLKFCKENKIQVMAYAPLGNGQLLENDMLLEIAKRLNKTTAQVLIKWGLQQGLIEIPKVIKFF
jgi:methylglyoxal/glyoxal reductase